MTTQTEIKIKKQNTMEQLTSITKELVFAKIKELELQIKHSESLLEDESFSKFHQMTTVEIELFEIQIELLKKKLFS